MMREGKNNVMSGSDAYRNSFILQVTVNMYIVHGTSYILEYGPERHGQISTTDTGLLPATTYSTRMNEYSWYNNANK